MLFRSQTTSKTWDGIVHFDKGTYYLYYLTCEQHVSDAIALATSPDGVHWQDQGRVLWPSPQMVRYLGGGSVWKDLTAAPAERYVMNYSEWQTQGEFEVQSLFFATSADLRRWEKLPDTLRFDIDEHHYRRTNPQARGPWEHPRWDGLSAIPNPAGGYYGYWTAHPNNFLGFGFGKSSDGLHWEALPAPRIEWEGDPSMIFIEVGGVCLLDGKIYAMLADYASTHCGMFLFEAREPAGPFRPAAKNFALMTNRRKMHAYFARFFDSPEGPLVCHHVIAEGKFSEAHCVVYYAPLKKARVIDGAFHLAWWPGNQILKNRLIFSGSTAQLAISPGQGSVLEIDLELPARLILGDRQGRGTGICVEEGGKVLMGAVQDGWECFKVEEWVDRGLDFGLRPRLRLLVHRTMLEVYLNDIFIQCYTAPAVPVGMIIFEKLTMVNLWDWDMNLQ